MLVRQIVPIILYALVAVSMILCSRNLLHILQLEGYKNTGLIKWIKHNFKKVYCLPLIFSAVLIIVQILLNIHLPRTITLYFGMHWMIIAIYILLILVYARRMNIEKAKKPLVYTGRIKRLFVYISLLYTALAIGMYFLDFRVLKSTPFEGVLVLSVLLFVGVVIFFSNLAALPIEAVIKKWYFNDAKAKLKLRNDIIKIGITGSYGKTSCKFILGTILSEKFNVLVPPSSYNTPMGLTRVIREQMEKAHEVFIAEMGARNKGDINELCRLVRPKCGMITSIGPQHLETFGNIKKVAETKYELIENLPDDGCAFFPADNDICLSLYEKTKVEKYLFATDYKGEAFARAKNIETGSFGSRFDLILGDETINCETKLLGKHNINNIIGCACIAKKLGLNLKQIHLGIRKIEPVEHRLCLMPTANGINVIDDAFNSNPMGVRAAMEVLSGFEGRKIVVTPGMVELGRHEQKENYEFGKIMADVADVVYLIGPKHTKPIYDGMADAGFKKENIRVFKSLNEATKELWSDVKLGDTIIFENDLPDNYNE